jgi:ribonuclease BN (tRNA processing enzyme)
MQGEDRDGFALPAPRSEQLQSSQPQFKIARLRQAMHTIHAVIAAIASTLVAPGTPAAAQSTCASEPLAVQVLGSGGPHAGDTRASTGYLVWQNGKAVVMVDAGGGTFLRFGEAGARLQDLALLAISHLHPDHVSDLPALLWLSETTRKQPLKAAGPSGGGAFPPFDTFVSRLFDAGTGAFPILGGTVGKPGQGVRLDLTVLDAAAGTPQRVPADAGVEVSAIGVPHADVPSVAYKVLIGGRSIVFAADQNGTDPKFVEFASGADVLVMHLAVSQQTAPFLAQVHARPSTVGQVAQGAKAKTLILSHLMKAPPAFATPQWFSLSDLDGAIAEVRKAYSGTVEAAADLQCIPIR